MAEDVLRSPYSWCHTCWRQLRAVVTSLAIFWPVTPLPLDMRKTFVELLIWYIDNILADSILSPTAHFHDLSQKKPFLPEWIPDWPDVGRSPSSQSVALWTASTVSAGTSAPSVRPASSCTKAGVWAAAQREPSPTRQTAWVSKDFTNAHYDRTYFNICLFKYNKTFIELSWRAISITNKQVFFISSSLLFFCSSPVPQTGWRPQTAMRDTLMHYWFWSFDSRTVRKM